MPNRTRKYYINDSRKGRNSSSCKVRKEEIILRTGWGSKYGGYRDGKNLSEKAENVVVLNDNAE
jgi:hypothetical protein